MMPPWASIPNAIAPAPNTVSPTVNRLFAKNACNASAIATIANAAASNFGQT